MKYLSVLLIMIFSFSCDSKDARNSPAWKKTEAEFQKHWDRENAPQELELKKWELYHLEIEIIEEQFKIDSLKLLVPRIEKLQTLREKKVIALEKELFGYLKTEEVNTYVDSLLDGVDAEIESINNDIMLDSLISAMKQERELKKAKLINEIDNLEALLEKD